MKTIPDYGVNISQISAPDVDNAELAARLGIDWFRRSGRVIYWDKCDSLSPWYSAAYGTGGSVTVDNTTSYDGANCFKLIPGMDGSKAARILKYFPTLSSLENIYSKLGIDFYFNVELTAGNPVLQLFVDLIPIGSIQASNCYLKLHFFTGQLEYWNNGGWHNLNPQTFPFWDSIGSMGHVWHNLKYVFGWGKHYNVYLDGLTVPLPYDATPLISPIPCVSTRLDLYYTDPDEQSKFRIDNIIATIDEA